MVHYLFPVHEFVQPHGQASEGACQEDVIQGGHGTGKTAKTGNLVLTFSKQGKHREFCSDTGKNLLTQGKYFDCDY